jgi:hypothetical protein
VEAGEVTLQEKEPTFGALAMTVDQVEPPSRLTSIFTSEPALDELQVISLASPIYQVSPPLGVVTVIVDG